MKKYLLMLVIYVMVLSCFFGKTLVMAKSADDDHVTYNRYYTDIEIEKGDTLWSIAKTYNKNSNMEIREYIKEVKQMNSMIGDSIEAGDNLTIVYFAERPIVQ